MKDAGCTDYSYGDAPVICLEGVNNPSSLTQAKRIRAPKKTGPEANKLTKKAKQNKCLKAAKCRLVSKDEADKNGCCEWQTGNHTIPHAAVKDTNWIVNTNFPLKLGPSQNAPLSSYTYGSAPTMCMEGVGNHNGGSHEQNHKLMCMLMAGTSSKQIRYETIQNYSVEAAMKSGAGHCSPNCIQAQQDNYFQPGNPGNKDKKMHNTCGCAGSSPKVNHAHDSRMHSDGIF